jgi:predicted HTH transcriptional regulator
MTSNIKCHKCNREIPENEAFVSRGNALCEDCYIDTTHKIKVCNPLGERAKTAFRKSHGLEGTDGLTDLQKEIYQYIQSKGKVTRPELLQQFKLSENELENHFAFLRQSKLAKGKKEKDTVYITLWSHHDQ